MGRVVQSYTAEQGYSGGAFTTPTNKGRYAERMAYDKNGNITQLARRQYVAAQSQTVVFDSLAYSYTGNRLWNVHDAATASLPAGQELYSFEQSPAAANPLTTEFTYDAVGAITSDFNRGATVTYDRQGRSKTIQKGSVTMEYTYDGFGQKIGERTTTGTTVDRRLFVMGAELQVTELSQTGSNLRSDQATYSMGGVALRYSQVSSDPVLKWTFAITDAQGTPRVLFQVNGSGQAVAIERNHYYATGLKIAGLSGETAGEEWREGYAEGVRIARQLSLTWQEHGVRHYDPTLGRWNQYEPLANKLNAWSPYAYGFNDFLNTTDPNGAYPRYGPNESRVLTLADEDGLFPSWSRNFGRGAGGGHYVTRYEDNYSHDPDNNDPTETPGFIGSVAMGASGNEWFRNYYRDWVDDDLNAQQCNGSLYAEGERLFSSNRNGNAFPKTPAELREAKAIELLKDDGVTTYKQKRVGDWRSDNYLDCSEFVMKCFENSCVDLDPMTIPKGYDGGRGSENQRNQIVADGTYVVDILKVQRGDAIFFDIDGNGNSTHIGIVARYNSQLGVIHVWPTGSYPVTFQAFKKDGSFPSGWGSYLGHGRK
jgi:RHS repeat-associated protein